MPPRGSSAPAPAKAAARRQPRAITTDYVEALKGYSRLLFDGGMHGGKDAKRPEVLAAKIEVGRDLGIPATQAVAWIAIINGRPSIYGDLGMALIRQSGLLAPGYPKEWYEGTEGEDDFAACFRIKRLDGEERTERFSVADAKQARLWGKAGPWTEYPRRQLMWRAKGFACRDEFQDVLCGLVFAEEAADIPEPPRVVVATAAGPGNPDDPPAPAAIAAPNPPPGPPALTAARTMVTDDQLDRLADLQDLVFASKGLGPKLTAERDETWTAVLADYGVDTARDLTAGQAAELIEHLGQIHDPFTHPPAAAAAPALALT